MELSQQEYWSRLPFPPPGDLPNPGTEPASPASFALQVDLLPLRDLGSPHVCNWHLSRDETASCNIGALPDFLAATEKEMATLAWRIPGMGEPGRLPSMGSHRVGHD